LVIKIVVKRIPIKSFHSFSKPFVSISFQILLLILIGFLDNRMGKRQDWSVTACIFLFLSLASQIHCRSHIPFPSPKRGVSSSGDTSHFNVIQRESVPSPKDKDLIQQLPGQPSDVTFKQYGGYVAVNKPAGRFLYYYFVETIKPGNTTPLVIWFNGGMYI